MKKLILLILLCAFHSTNLFAQNFSELISLPGSGVTAMKVNTNGDLFVTTASYNYPMSGQQAGLYKLAFGTFIFQVITPLINVPTFNCRTVEVEEMGYVYSSVWKDPSAYSEALYVSSNFGNTWARTFDIGAGNNIFSIKADPDNNNVYIGSRNGVYKSTNNGMNFTLSNSGKLPNSYTYDIDKASGKLLAATSTGLYRSLDLGDNWSRFTGIPSADTPKSIVIIPSATGNKALVGTDDGDIYISDEDLWNYTLIFGFENSDIIAMLVLHGIQPNEFNLFVSSFPQNMDNLGTGLFYSKNSASNFSDFGQGIPSPYRISAIGGHADGNNLKIFAGSFNNTSNGSVIYSKDYTVSVTNLSTEIPESFLLSQNYPNPFNPETKIKFQVKEFSNIKIVVYNSSGKEIRSLVNQIMNPGTYETEFNASDLSSGIYFYKMFADGKNNYSETKKMILVK